MARIRPRCRLGVVGVGGFPSEDDIADKFKPESGMAGAFIIMSKRRVKADSRLHIIEKRNFTIM